MINKKALNKLNQDINNIIEEYLEEFSSIILSWYKNPIEENWQEFEDNLYNLILETLEKVYAISSKSIKKIYGIDKKLPTSKIVTYDRDNLTLRDRIRKWFCPKEIETSKDNSEVIRWENKDNKYFIKDKLIAVNKVIQIAKTEAIYQKQTVFYDKIKDLCDFVILEESAECKHNICDEYSGEWPIDEFIYPPYHPNCLCEPIYEITDDEDDIEDLDLE